MASEPEWRERLLEEFRRTGNDNFRRAAECLNESLMDFLEHVGKQKPKHRPISAGTARELLTRIDRMAVSILRSQASGQEKSVRSAAIQEIDTHGLGVHYSKDAAVTYLCRAFPKYRKSAETVARYVIRCEREWCAIGKARGGKV